MRAAASVALAVDVGENETNLALMRLIDKQFLETPFYGAQQMTWHLQNEGHPVNVKRIRRLMRLMGLMPIGVCAGRDQARSRLRWTDKKRRFDTLMQDWPSVIAS